MKSDIEFPVGEYVTNTGHRITVVGVYKECRWVTTLNEGNEPSTYFATSLRSWGCKPYVAPVVTERWCNVYHNGVGAVLFNSADEAVTYCSDSHVGLLKLTFEDGRLVKAEVEKP